MYVCMYVCVCMNACMRGCMYVCVYVSMYVCTYVCMYYVCMYVCKNENDCFLTAETGTSHMSSQSTVKYTKCIIESSRMITNQYKTIQFIRRYVQLPLRSSHTIN